MTAPNAIGAARRDRRCACAPVMSPRTRWTTSRPTAPAPCSVIRSSSRRSRKPTGAVRQSCALGSVEDQSRASGGCGGHRGLHQGDARGAAAVTFRPICTSPSGIRLLIHRPTRFFVPTETTPWPADRRPAPGGGVVVRLRWNERACGDRAGSGSRPQPRRAVHRLRCARWWCRARRPNGWRRWRRLWPTGWTVPAPVSPLADIAHTLDHHRARQHDVRHSVCRRRCAGGDRPAGVGGRVSPPPGWCPRTTGRAGRARFSSTPGRVRSGPGWAAQLLADEPAFAAAVAELEPVFVASWGSRCATCWPRRAGDRRRACAIGAGGNAVGVDRAVAFLRSGTRCGHRAFDGRGQRRGGGRRADRGRRVAGDRRPGRG